MDDQNRRQRLCFRSWHRGTREMDLLLGSFADAHVAKFTAAELDQYEAILHLGDPDLYNWITHTALVPAQHDSAVMQLLIRHQYADHS